MFAEAELNIQLNVKHWKQLKVKSDLEDEN